MESLNITTTANSVYNPLLAVPVQAGSIIQTRKIRYALPKVCVSRYVSSLKTQRFIYANVSINLERPKDCTNFVITNVKKRRYGSVGCKDRKF